VFGWNEKPIESNQFGYFFFSRAYRRKSAIGWFGLSTRFNNISAEFVPNAHQTAARYARNTSEFENCGLTEAYKSAFFAPFVNESTVQMGVEFNESIPISSNGTILVIGQIKHVFFPENCLHEDGFLDLNKAGSITCTGLDAYYTTEPIGRYAYAKTDRAATILPKEK
jgi:flavin reductase (DIM6/NTAB) family NADH-FMN oxidoreductase RutF